MLSCNRRISGEQLNTLLPAEFRDSLKRLKELPLYELIEQILALLNITEAKDEEAYVYAFLDHAAQYINSRQRELILKFFLLRVRERCRREYLKI